MDYRPAPAIGGSQPYYNNGRVMAPGPANGRDYARGYNNWHGQGNHQDGEYGGYSQNQQMAMPYKRSYSADGCVPPKRMRHTSVGHPEAGNEFERDGAGPPPQWSHNHPENYQGGYPAGGDRGGGFQGHVGMPRRSYSADYADQRRYGHTVHNGNYANNGNMPVNMPPNNGNMPVNMPPNNGNMPVNMPHNNGGHFHARQGPGGVGGPPEPPMGHRQPHYPESGRHLPHQGSFRVVSQQGSPASYPVQQGQFKYDEGGRKINVPYPQYPPRDERNDRETINRTASTGSDVSRDRHMHEEDIHIGGRSPPCSLPPRPVHPVSPAKDHIDSRRGSGAEISTHGPAKGNGVGNRMNVALLRAASEAQGGTLPRSVSTEIDSARGRGAPNVSYDDAEMTDVTTGKPYNHTSPAVDKRSGRMLLALPEDRIALSEALCIIRENVEVFRASPSDVDAPAPGRKNPVVVGQVGLRCIHCCHCKDRVKRAVCYPSSIRRIYRTITDMKLDHFGACAHVPRAIKIRLDELKVVSARSTGTTMRYFVDSAKKLGMVDATNGIRFQSDKPLENEIVTAETAPASSQQPLVSSPVEKSRPMPKQCSSMLSLINTSNKLLGEGSQSEPNKTSSFEPIPTPKSVGSSDTEVGYQGHPKESGSFSSCSSNTEVINRTESSSSSDQMIPPALYTGKVPLSLLEDKCMLSPLRCFLRENVYVFSASEEDIAARTPTNFSVVLGQVGICCKHCYSLPPKDRMNRAVCFPFSIDRIYQSVADMQRFHFINCTHVPDDVKEKFNSLKSASSKGSKGLATRQYWITSAKKLGLVDSPTGIRFGRDPHTVSEPAISLDILAQAALDLTKRRPIVLPEDKPLVADFLYVVMQQLQPCQFTEADRNKRRMKEVGCIGVECKHCVGQAESRKFFWSSVNAVESNFISVHTHLMECKWVPDDTTAELARLKLLRKEQTARLKSGSQKAFFARVWERLHSYEGVIKSNDSFDTLPSQEPTLTAV